MKQLVQNLSPIYSPIYEKLVRKHLPRKLALLNGVLTPASRLLDPVSHYPNHKEKNIQEIKNMVCSGDTVLEIGAGYGVCTIWCARMASKGQVISYEGGEEMCDIARDAIKLNEEVLNEKLNDRISIRHAVVGESENVWGSHTKAEKVRPSELPTCDVLVTDCEGAELSILQKMDLSPSKVIIEAHPTMGSPACEVKTELESRGYTTKVISKEDSEVDIVVAE